MIQGIKGGRSTRRNVKLRVFRSEFPTGLLGQELRRAVYPERVVRPIDDLFTGDMAPILDRNHQGTGMPKARWSHTFVGDHFSCPIIRGITS